MHADTWLKRLKQEIAYWRNSDWPATAVGDFFDSFSEEYDDINEQTDSYFRRFTDASRLLDGQGRGRFLDVQSRSGNGTAYFYEQGLVESAVCADFSEGLGRVCKRRLDALGFKDYEWVHLRDYALPFEEASFDVTLSLETVEHVAKPAFFINELARVTKPDGMLILSTPNFLWEPVHAFCAVTRLHHSEGPHRFLKHRFLLDTVAQAGFDIIHHETTVLIPGGPDWLVRAGYRFEAWTKNSLMPWLGLRRVIIARRNRS